MKATIVFLICSLSLSLFAPSIEASSLLERYQIISPVKMSLKEVLMSINSKLKSGAPLDSILKMLDDIKSGVTEEQSRHDKVYNDQTLECEDEYKFRVQQVEDSSSTLDKAERERNSCNGTKIKDMVDYEVNQATQKQTLANLEIVEEQIARTTAEYTQKQTDHNEALDGLNSCLVILEGLFSGSAEESFAQVAQSTTQITSQKELLTDEIVVEKIQELLNHLKENVLNSFQEYSEEEKKLEEELNERKASLHQYYAALQENEKRLVKDIEDMDSCLSVENSIVSAASDKKDRNKELMKSAKSMCDNFENEYKEATEARKNELHLIEEVKNVVEKRYKELPENLNDDEENF